MYFLVYFSHFFSITDTVQSWLANATLIKFKLTASARLTVQCFVISSSVLIMKPCC